MWEGHSCCPWFPLNFLTVSKDPSLICATTVCHVLLVQKKFLFPLHMWDHGPTWGPGHQNLSSSLFQDSTPLSASRSFFCECKKNPVWSSSKPLSPFSSLLKSHSMRVCWPHTLRPSSYFMVLAGPRLALIPATWKGLSWCFFSIPDCCFSDFLSPLHLLKLYRLDRPENFLLFIYIRVIA